MCGDAAAIERILAAIGGSPSRAGRLRESLVVLAADQGMPARLRALVLDILGRLPAEGADEVRVALDSLRSQDNLIVRAGLRVLGTCDQLDATAVDAICKLLGHEADLVKGEAFGVLARQAHLHPQCVDALSRAWETAMKSWPRGSSKSAYTVTVASYVSGLAECRVPIPGTRQDLACVRDTLSWDNDVAAYACWLQTGEIDENARVIAEALAQYGVRRPQAREAARMLAKMALGVDWAGAAGGGLGAAQPEAVRRVLLRHPAARDVLAGLRDTVPDAQQLLSFLDARGTAD